MLSLPSRPGLRSRVWRGRAGAYLLFVGVEVSPKQGQGNFRLVIFRDTTRRHHAGKGVPMMMMDAKGVVCAATRARECCDYMLKKCVWDSRAISGDLVRRDFGTWMWLQANISDLI